MKFYLGTHMPNFVETVNIPWFVSVSRLLKRKSKINGDWIMDSGGFTQIAKHGRYTISEQEYLEVIKFQLPEMAFCQDWMCEPVMLEKTGLTVKDHQDKTTENFLSLSTFTNRVRPVIQGWEPNDYVNHLRDYKKAGVDMHQLFGVGTVCSRNGNPLETWEIFSAILQEEPGLKLHGFGIKTESLIVCQKLLWSADSMAWSTRGRHTKFCGNCPVKSCENCMEFALLWRKKILHDICDVTKRRVS